MQNENLPAPLDTENVNLDSASFLEKVASSAKAAGCKVICAALKLFYAYRNPQTPLWAKSTIAAALAYFVLPIDAIPDFIPGVGYVDDLGVMLGALRAVAGSIDDEVKDKAQAKLKKFFGSGCSC